MLLGSGESIPGDLFECLVTRALLYPSSVFVIQDTVGHDVTVWNKGFLAINIPDSDWDMYINRIQKIITTLSPHALSVGNQALLNEDEEVPSPSNLGFNIEDLLTDTDKISQIESLTLLNPYRFALLSTIRHLALSRYNDLSESEYRGLATSNNIEELTVLNLTNNIHRVLPMLPFFPHLRSLILVIQDEFENKESQVRKLRGSVPHITVPILRNPTYQ